MITETFRYWLLSFLWEPVAVQTSLFTESFDHTGLRILLLFSDGDVRAATARAPGGADVIAIVPPACPQPLLREVSSRFSRHVSLDRCMTTLIPLLGHDYSGMRLSEDPLTNRERQVLRLIAQGAPLKEIAYRLGISFHTVVSHRRNLYLKTGAHSLQQLALYAMLHVISSAEP